MKPDYYRRADGTHVMTFEVFQAMPFEKVCRVLRSRTTKPLEVMNFRPIHKEK